MRTHYSSRPLFNTPLYIGFKVIFDTISTCMSTIRVIANIVIVFMEMFAPVGMLFNVKIIRYAS